MLRYRTETITIRDMTYLFLVIVISLLNGVGPLTPVSAAIVCSILCVVVAIGETTVFAPRIFEKNIRYENIHNIRPENYDLLVADIKERTGLDVKSIEILNIDFLSDIANLKVLHGEENIGANAAAKSEDATSLVGEKSA